MNTIALLQHFREIFPEHGAFTLLPGQSISTAVGEHEVPNKYGAYVISSVTISRTEVIYIGKAGTVGHHGRQLERSRLTPAPYKETKQRDALTGLHFEWFVTFFGQSAVLPAFAEAQLLQSFFCEHGRLTQLNASV